MSIHVDIGYKDGMRDSFVTVIDKSFETSEAAVIWWEDTNFNSNRVLEVLNAAKEEYVGTEHEIMNAANDGYTNLWCCIEGQEGKDTFDDRLKDLDVQEIVWMGDNQFQLNGLTLDGRRVWQSIRLMTGFQMNSSKVINLPE